MFWTVKVHHQEVNCRIQALWYNIRSKYVWFYGESSICITYDGVDTDGGSSNVVRGIKNLRRDGREIHTGFR
jgi:hypothetical protein